ncbi:MAG: carbon-nitrogen hydrolase family protein [Armatimonadota bacterium]
MIVLETMEADIETDSDIKPSGLRTWAAREVLKPHCRRTGNWLVVESSGSPGCFGGWDIVFDDIEAGRWYEIGLDWQADEVPNVLDSVPIFVFWMDEGDERCDYDYLIIRTPEGSEGRAERTLRAPDEACRAVLRFGLRWTATGRAVFKKPSVNAGEAPPERTVRVATITPEPAGDTVDERVEFFCDWIRQAADDCNPDLVLLPEVATSWRLDGTVIDHARPIPGPQTDALCATAAECEVMVALSVMERDGDLVYNTGLIIEKDGLIEATYRKSNLAIPEGWWGVTPGEEIPVFDTSIGRLSMNICKDVSTSEQVRVPAVNGAEMLLVPIMGDFRSVQWRARQFAFSPDRWKVIMRARAIENHLWMVIARNNRQASCIINPGGDILAYNDGSHDIIWADCDLSERLRPKRGSSFHDATWAERRPHLYGDLSK